MILGGIIGAGACLVVVGTSLLDEVDRAMRRSITGSVTGHLQVYSSESGDPLEVLGGLNSESPDIAPLPDFAAVKAAVSSVPNVAAVVPMGIDGAAVMSGNTIDQALARLRHTASERDRGSGRPELARTYAAQKSHVRQIVTVLGGDLGSATRIEAEHDTTADDRATLERARSAEFWDHFDAEVYANLEFLENKVAPLASDAATLYLRYVGTDPQAFERAFDRMTIVDGQQIPPGKRGFLFSKYVYEEQVKLKAARGLDKIARARDVGGQTIASDGELRRIVRENSSGVREIVLQLDANETAEFRRKLQALLHTPQTDVARLLAAFFDTDDSNFAERYAFFYAELAPALDLYRVRIGDDLTIKTFGRGGYVHSKTLKVYGTYAFKGLEKSPEAGHLNMLDLVSFRELYGFISADRAKELAAMRASAGATDVDRGRAEAELFGTKRAVQEITAADASPTVRDRSLGAEAGASAAYDPRELQSGVLLNAAVLVRDESKLNDTLRAIEAAGKRAGLPLKAISWQSAAGLLGQFVTLMRTVLYAAVFIIFVVGLVVINNSLVMATLERVREIGTLRAIGAQRQLILAMLVLESLAIGLAAGIAGALVGASVLSVLGVTGIGAGSDILTFVFSGPRLYPRAGSGQFAFALATVSVVSLLSSLYPAWIAMRVTPRESMQSEE